MPGFELLGKEEQAEVNDLFDRNQNLTEFFAHAGAIDTLFKCATHAFLKARVRVHDIPAQCHDQPP